MKKSLVYLSLACLLVGLLSLAGCSKKEETTIEESTPAAGTTEPATTPMGTEMGTDMGAGTTPMGTDMAPMGTDMTPPPAK